MQNKFGDRDPEAKWGRGSKSAAHRRASSPGSGPAQWGIRWILVAGRGKSGDPSARGSVPMRCDPGGKSGVYALRTKDASAQMQASGCAPVVGLMVHPGCKRVSCGKMSLSDAGKARVSLPGGFEDFPLQGLGGCAKDPVVQVHPQRCLVLRSPSIPPARSLQAPSNVAPHTPRQKLHFQERKALNVNLSSLK